MSAFKPVFWFERLNMVLGVALQFGKFTADAFLISSHEVTAAHTVWVECMRAKNRGSNCNVEAIGRITVFFLKVVIAATLSGAVGSASSTGGAPLGGRISSCAVLSHNLEMGSPTESDIFLRDFPYDTYLDKCDGTDFTRLEIDRSLLQENGIDGDNFLSTLFSRYLLRHPANPISPDEVKPVLDLADRALAFGAGNDQPGNDRRPAIYRTIGYMLLDDLDSRVKVAISNKQLVKDSREAQYLLKALAERGYWIAFPKSRWEKLIEHVKAGHWRYIGRRLWEEILQYRSVFLVTFAVLVGVLLITRRFILRRVSPTAKVKCVGKRSVTTTIFPLLLLVLGGCVHEASAQTLLEVPVYKYYDGDMVIKRLYYGSKEIGSTIWLRRGSDKIRAKYFASGQVYQKYYGFNKPIVLVCSGAFTIRNVDGSSPEGLTVDNGTIVNRDRNEKMDGLVIVYSNGGIGVSDIAKENLTVEYSGGKKKVLDILKSEDKTTFLNWAAQAEATVFQTQLLASKKGLRLDPSKAHKELRERRFLAIVQDNKTKEVIHIIVNVSTRFYLGELTKLVYEYLQGDTTVVGLLNLDTGDYDILQVNSATGRPLSDLAGLQPITKATNLLVYYYAKQ